MKYFLRDFVTSLVFFTGVFAGIFISVFVAFTFNQVLGMTLFIVLLSLFCAWTSSV